MGYLLATFQSLYATLREGLKKPSTVEYPKVKRERAPRLRASFALTKDAEGDENCIGCKKCEKVCPSEVIAVTMAKKPSPVTGKPRGYATDFTLNLQACIVCELCVQVCPTDAIIMVQDQERPGFEREDLTLTMDRLYRNAETKGRWAWSNATILAEHQKPPEAPKPAAAAAPAKAVAPADAPKPAGAATGPQAVAPSTTAPVAPTSAAVEAAAVVAVQVTSVTVEQTANAVEVTTTVTQVAAVIEPAPEAAPPAGSKKEGA